MTIVGFFHCFGRCIFCVMFPYSHPYNFFSSDNLDSSILESKLSVEKKLYGCE